MDTSAPTARGYAANQCVPLETMLGEGGNDVNADVSNERRMESAIADLRNKAAAKGANFVQYAVPVIAPSGDKALVSGTAYRCSGAPASASHPGQPGAPAPSDAVRSFETKDGKTGLSMDLQFTDFKIRVGFIGNEPNLVWWELLEPTSPSQTLPANCQSIIEVDGTTTTYDLLSSDERSSYFSLPVSSLENMVKARRVAGKMCGRSWGWNEQHLAAVQKFVLRVKEQ